MVMILKCPVTYATMQIDRLKFEADPRNTQ